MRLVVTGGGTGGHIYPALEVARLCVERGASIHYLGSIRGQEGKICASRGIAFEGFPAEPLYSMRTPRGWIALVNLLRASRMASRALRKIKPSVVFSTGGYSAAPVVRAALGLGIPYVIHEQNSIPGRSNRLFAKQARNVAVTFNKSVQQFDGAKVVRTGMPIRKELRLAASSARDRSKQQRVLVTGGSQGSRFLNEHVPSAAKELGNSSVEWQHVSGPAHYQETSALARAMSLGDRYRVHGFLEAAGMAEAYSNASVAVTRSGGSLAELAMFGLPSVLVPLPSAAANHQYHNALEFQEMGAAVIQREAELTAESLAGAIQRWLDDSEARAKAALALRAWDVPDATERIVGLIEEAAA